MRRILQVAFHGVAGICGVGLLLCLSMAHSQRLAIASPTACSSATMSGTQFVIADLDGDHTPDLASVEVKKQQSSSTSYAIRLQFGAGGGSYIDVKGPLGGMRLAVRDVNGDDRLDLVLTSATDRRVIQVLLNDGHGKFAAAEREPFSAVGLEGEFGLREREPGPSDRIGLTAIRNGFHVDVAAQRENSPHNLNAVLAVRNNPVACSREMGLRCGRSPPSLPAVS